MANRPGMAVKIAIGRPKPGSNLGSDLGSPSDFGTPNRTPTPGRRTTPADDDLDADQDQLTGATPAVPPEAVHYHDEEQRCELCQHFGQDGQCAVLQMPVQAEGGCNAFSAQDADQHEDQDMDADDLDDASGGAPLPTAGPTRSRGGYGS